MKARLGVNIDHVATLRQARGEEYPSIARATKVCLEAQVDQITAHLREDRRHIQDQDIFAIGKLCKEYVVPFNLEMGVAEKIIDIGIKCSPEWVCLVPEKREEQTTEGGLNLKDRSVYQKIKETMNKLRQEISGVNISLFVEAGHETMGLCRELKADAVEIHTGHYAQAYNQKKNTEHFFEIFQTIPEHLKGCGLGLHAGHGITEENFEELLKLKIFTEYNIGHWIIAESVFHGLAPVIKRLQGLIQNHPL